MQILSVKVDQDSYTIRLKPSGVGRNSPYTSDIVLLLFHILVLHEYWVMAENRIPLKLASVGVRVVAISILILTNYTVCLCVDPEGWGQWVWTHLKNHKNIGFLCNTGQDPLKNNKATKQVFNVGPA